MRFSTVNKGTAPPPPDIGAGILDALEAWADRYTAGGQMEEVWGFAGIPGGAGILNVSSHEELDEIISQSPVAPFSQTEIHPLVELREVVEHGKRAMEFLLAGARR